MTFFAFGLNQETAPVAIREAFALDTAALRPLYRSVSLSDEAEVMLLSTCNRTEVYLYGRRVDVAAMQAALGHRAWISWPADAAFYIEDEAAIRHLLQVASGLKSSVLGDAQVFAQVKEAYRVAVEEEGVGTVMHRLLHTAFRTAKRIINEAALRHGTASISTAAVDVARTYFEAHSNAGLAGCRVLLIGAGQMGRLALEALSLHDLARITIVNRSPERACSLARMHDAHVMAWDNRYTAVGKADLIIVASGAGEPVLRAEHMPVRSPQGIATLLVDIAMPRNIEPTVDALPGYTVIDLDTVDAHRRRAEVEQRVALPEARQICDEAVAEYVSWVFHQQALQPAIDAIRETFESIRVQEIERHHHRFSDLDRAELDRLTASMMQKLLAVPVVRLKSVDPDSIDFVRGIKLLQVLFSRPACEDESVTSLPSTGAASFVIQKRLRHG